MCGISGLVDFALASSVETLEQMNNALVHRGPDDGDLYWQQNADFQLGLAHRRLSILDLSANGRQPQTFANLTITFNGEIYNFQEIRAELTKLDYSFSTECDTEVILKAVHCFGLDTALAKFNGMFAMAIYNSKSQKLYLVRDRCGVKPLYYYHHQNIILFASELKSLVKHRQFQKKISDYGKQSYFSYGFICEPYTIYENCSKLLAGNYLTIDLQTKAITSQCYWNITECYRQPKLDITTAEAITEAEKLLLSACQYRTIADVPVGVFLSGGFDSSTVAALLSTSTQKVKTYTIGFNQQGYDEAQQAQAIAKHLGTQHHQHYCSPQDAVDFIEKIPEIWDEPFGDSSAIPTALVSKIARQQVTVAISADGGDELLGGYQKYQRVLKLQALTNNIPLLASICKTLSPLYLANFKFTPFSNKLLTALSTKDIAVQLKAICQVFHNHSLTQLTGNLLNLDTVYDNAAKLNDNLEQLLAIDLQTFMRDDVLAKVDRATMHIGLEGREPLLDYRFIEFVARLPANLKINGNKTKYLLRKINAKYLPPALMDRPKTGFEIPLAEWGKTNLQDYFNSYLSKPMLEQSGLNSNFVAKLLKHYNSGNKNLWTHIWLVLMYQMWYRQWVS